MLQNILETETEYSKDLQSLLTNYLRPLQNTDKYESLTPKLLFIFLEYNFCRNLSCIFSRLSSSDVALILGNLEEICTFQQMLVQSLEECTKWVSVLTLATAAAAPAYRSVYRDP